VASQAASKALPESPTERTRQLTSLALDRKYNELDVLAKAAFNIMAQGDWYGVDDKQVAGPLVNCYYASLDSAKTGATFGHIDRLCITLYPIWMQGRSKDPRVRYVTYDEFQQQHAVSGLRPPVGKSFMMELYESGTALENARSCLEQWTLDEQLQLDRERVRRSGAEMVTWLEAEERRWKRYREEYNGKIAKLLKEQGDAQLQTRPSAASSAAASISAAPAARKRGGGSESAFDEQKAALRESYRALLLEPFLHEHKLDPSPFSPLERPNDKMIFLAQVIYTQGYRAAHDALAAQKQQRKKESDAATERGDAAAAAAAKARPLHSPALSFVWSVVGKELLDIKRMPPLHS